MDAPDPSSFANISHSVGSPETLCFWLRRRKRTARGLKSFASFGSFVSTLSVFAERLVRSELWDAFRVGFRIAVLRVGFDL